MFKAYLMTSMLDHVKASVHLFKLPCTRNGIFILNDHSLYAPITSKECHAWFFMGPVDLPGVQARKRQNTKWKNLAHSGLEPTNLKFVTLCSTDRATWALIKDVLTQW